METTRLAGITLCVLVTGGRDGAAFRQLVKSLFAAGVRMVQVRDKEVSDDVLVERVRTAVAVAREIDLRSPPLVIVNDRVHVAAAAGADGVHVGAGDMPVVEARRLLGEMSIIGRTAHSLDEAHAAVAAGADYLGVGPCYPSTTKSFATHASRDFLHGAAALPLSVFAIGGITIDRLADLRALGITRVAVAASIAAVANPADAARRFLETLAG
jgi:thiamine-phosphate pyrophosphorylase